MEAEAEAEAVEAALKSTASTSLLEISLLIAKMYHFQQQLNKSQLLQWLAE